ncbi:MAG: transcriptional regulator, partial [Gammaproteobacteria bacterium]|nr:transcriptional regulator [Gammaproteobacteria bacterium]
MPSSTRGADIGRISREGHWFHEAWTARKAMQLLLPRDGLIGIAVEGLSEEDQSRASAGTVEIADLTIYYGQGANFGDAERVDTLQFKYSPKRADQPFRCSDAKKTIKKFAESYLDYRGNYSAAEVTEKLFFKLITNRPVFLPLEEAIKGIAEGRSLTGVEKTQAEQFKRATNLTGRLLREFASKCQIDGLAGTLHDTKTDLWKILVDWSATTDAQASARLGMMRDMVFKKAGYGARHRKVIRRVDVLDALGLSDITDLLPCPESLASAGPVVEREQLAEVASLVPQLVKPLIIHADGGVGKTVFLQSLASLLSEQCEVVLFDCFGGGAYRSPEDGRHLPNRGLVHIVNVLACKGLCDPILPGSESTEILFRTFRKRLTQCMQTITAVSPDRKLVLFIDAIDNAAEYANERKHRAFPMLLLESIHLSGPIPGVTVIASGRTHRVKEYISNIPHHGFELHAFTAAETASYLRERITDITATEIKVAQSRSEGNARILKYLATSDRGLLDSSEMDSPIMLDDLLNERIEMALREAIGQGYREEEIKTFLAGLSVLPPPVPLDEYAGACGMDIGVIRSFAADLAPLLDLTPQGMIFRDEPTETLVRERYGADKNALKRVVRNLFSRQEESVYAAQALPGLLQKLDQGKKLFKLAFDERFPTTITSTVGQRRIRYARLEAAVLHAANASDNNSLVRLLVELSTIAESDERGTNYITNNPDLVVNARDVDALRRLFETRTNWAGSRHARLTIASVLSGDLDDASRYFMNAFDWIRHDFESVGDNEYGRARPEHIDYVAIPFFRVAEGEHSKAIHFMRAFYPQYAFEISEVFFGLSRQAILRDRKFHRLLDAFLDDLTNEAGLLTGGLSFWRLSDQKQCKLLEKLGKVCRRTTNLKIDEKYSSDGSCKFSDGLRKAATIAVSFGMREEALSISLRAPHLRPRLWSMADPHSDRDVFPYLFRVALRAAVKGTEVYERDILPCELIPLAKRLRKSLTGDEFKKQLKDKIQAQMEKERDLKENEWQIREETRNQTDRFLNYRLTPLLKLTRVLASFLGAPLGQADRPFQEIIRVWAEARTTWEGHHYEAQFNYFFHWCGMRMAIFALWARGDLKAASIRFLLKHLHQQNYLSPSTLIEVIEIVATRPRFDIIVGMQAVQAQSLIEREDDVTTRSDLFAKLARAILPVSRREAMEYFKVGLEQLDAIGSGDYEFTNELLHFASSIKGEELSEKDVHTFTNICELNMSYEPEKFPWSTFATAMSKISGPRGLAKLSRWHDRGKVNLKYTLLPYLTALVRDRKIAPEDALALNRLAAPAELWICNTEAFATAIYEKQFPNAETLFTELIRQYEENNPRMSVGSTVKSLATIAGEVLGKRQATTKYLSSTHRRLAGAVDGLNEQQNYPSSKGASLGQLPDDTQQEMRRLREIASTTDPLDEDALRGAVGQLKDMMISRELEQKFFQRLRARVHLADRSIYIGLVACLKELDIYAKLQELEKCKNTWATSSASLDTFYRTLATPILNVHVDEFLDSDGLSTYNLKEVEDLTGVPMSALTLELVKILSMSDWGVPASAWLGLAAIICGDADEGQGQKALGTLLNSSSAKLTSTVVDGPWKRGLYPAYDLSAITSGLVWQLLGSPRATDRWYAAHSVRRFAQLDRWEVIEALVDKLPATDSKAFGAPELPFYYLHARLWLLIALARIALDFPTEVAKHHELLMKMALNRSHPHIVIRHFAAQAVLACDEAGALSLSEKKREELHTVNNSPFPDRGDGKAHYGYADFYAANPEGASDLDEKFFFDYEFDKYEVHDLASVFVQQGWAVRDLITDEIRRLNPSVTSMYEEAGRETPSRRSRGALISGFHVYGQYLAWHAVHFAAGRLLSRHPITENWDHGRKWSDWLSYKLLTRSDGLWLSDGMDRPPLRTRIDVLEKGEEGLALTGDRDKLMSLIGIDNRT